MVGICRRWCLGLRVRSTSRFRPHAWPAGSAAQSAPTCCPSDHSDKAPLALVETSVRARPHRPPPAERTRGQHRITNDSSKTTSFRTDTKAWRVGFSAKKARVAPTGPTGPARCSQLKIPSVPKTDKSRLRTRVEPGAHEIWRRPYPRLKPPGYELPWSLPVEALPGV